MKPYAAAVTMRENSEDMEHTLDSWLWEMTTLEKLSLSANALDGQDVQRGSRIPFQQ